jgi:hypothetical protein
MIVGDGTATLQESVTLALNVTEGATLVIRRAILNGAVQCVGGNIELDTVSITSATPARPSISLQSCTASIVNSVINDATTQAILATNSTLDITGSRVLKSAGNGIEASGGGQLTIARCTISEGAGFGITVSDVTLKVTRSTISINHDGGLRSIGGLFDVTNNFVFANGNDADGEFGGMRLETTLPGARVEHNTIAMNDSGCIAWARPPPTTSSMATLQAASRNPMHRSAEPAT